ncbi:MAG TPA: citrate synthase [Actinomycetota bacterium]|nr:citrate synthase [Actinomycetota bacterium]
MAEIRLGEIMTPDPLTTPPQATLAEAASAMRERKVGSTVVCDQGTVVGILTERDLVRAAGDGADPNSTRVEQWMTRSPVTMTPADDITHALDRMLDRGFRHLPILDGEGLTGIVSLRQLIAAARIRKVDPWSPGTGRGLENVTVAETELSFIDGQAGRLIYRGYNAVELALHKTFNDVWHLMFYGSLPTGDEFSRRTAELRGLPLDVQTLRDLAASHGTFMSTLQAAISAAGASMGLKPWLDDDPSAAEKAALKLGAVVPTIVTALWRLEQGLEPVDPDPNLSHAANYLWMMHGDKPTDDQVVATDRYLVLLAEHGMNASTFTGRVIASTGADVGSAVAGAAGALSGPLHGGAPSLVLDMLDEIGAPELAQEWIQEAVRRGKRIMGFGHRVYKAEDPRAACFRETAIELGSERVALAKVVETATLETLRAAKPGRALYTNVEYWSAVVLERAGIPRKLFTPTFAVARTIGWTAHILEQVRDNRLIRPSADYTGPTGLSVTG